LNRYKTLRDANSDLNSRQGSQDVENDEKRHYFSQITKDRANEVLNRNNEIAMLQKHLESCSVSTLQMQGNVDTSIKGMSDKILQLGQMLASIENLLERFETQARHVKRSKESKKTFGGGGGDDGGEDDLAKEGKKAYDHLEDIATYMIDYASIVKDWEAEQMMSMNREEEKGF